MRSLKLALGFMLLATAAVAQSYPSPTFSKTTTLGNNTAPTIDGAFATVQNGTKTAYQIYQNVVPSGWYFFDTTRSVLDFESGTTVQGGAAYGAYTYNNVAEGTIGNERNAVGLFALGINAKTGARTWGINTVCGDSTANSVPTSFASTCIGYELDFTSYNSGSNFEGISLILQGPTMPAGANALQVSLASGSVAKWTNALVIDNGATTNAAVIIGASSISGSNVASQLIKFNYFDGSGTAQAGSIYQTKDGLNISGGIVAGTGYLSHAGTSGAFGGNYFNLYWTGSAMQLWVDAVNIGNIGVGAGVACSGAPTASFTTNATGIVTHC
jgi:hypothetical protein